MNLTRCEEGIRSTIPLLKKHLVLLIACMSIVVLDGLPIEHHQGPLVNAAVDAGLTRLLAADGLADSLKSGDAMPSMRAPEIQLASVSNPARVGRQVDCAASVTV